MGDGRCSGAVALQADATVSCDMCVCMCIDRWTYIYTYRDSRYYLMLAFAVAGRCCW